MENNFSSGNNMTPEKEPSLTIRPLMAENLRKMAKSPQDVKIVSVKRG